MASKKTHRLRYAAAFVTAAYGKARLILHALRALPMDLFTKPSRQADERFYKRILLVVLKEELSNAC
jgi:hypothetical protein